MSAHRTILILAILLISAILYADSFPWEVENFPFSGSTDPDAINKGYGDWCLPTQGMHEGLDFGDPDPGGESGVYVPTCTGVSTYYSCGFYPDLINPGVQGCMMVVSIDFPVVGGYWNRGWGIGHINANESPYTFQTAIPAGAIVAPTMPVRPTHWPHVHMQWAALSGLPFTNDRGTTPTYQTYAEWDYDHNPLTYYRDIFPAGYGVVALMLYRMSNLASGNPNMEFGSCPIPTRIH